MSLTFVVVDVLSDSTCLVSSRSPWPCALLKLDDLTNAFVVCTSQLDSESLALVNHSIILSINLSIIHVFIYQISNVIELAFILKLSTPHEACIKLAHNSEYKYNSKVKIKYV